MKKFLQGMLIGMLTVVAICVVALRGRAARKAKAIEEAQTNEELKKLYDVEDAKRGYVKARIEDLEVEETVELIESWKAKFGL